MTKHWFWAITLIAVMSSPAHAGFEQIYDKTYKSVMFGTYFNFTINSDEHGTSSDHWYQHNFYVPINPEVATDMNGGWDLTWVSPDGNTNYMHASTSLSSGDTISNTIFWYEGSLPIETVSFPTSFMDFGVWMPNGHPEFDAASDWFLSGWLTFSDDFNSFAFTGMGSLPGVMEFTYFGGTEFQATPIPAAIWLLGSGLVGLVGLRRKMKA